MMVNDLPVMSVELLVQIVYHVLYGKSSPVEQISKPVRANRKLQKRNIIKKKEIRKLACNAF